MQPSTRIFLPLILSLCCVAAFASTTSNSCANRCGDRFNSNNRCQCNSQCSKHLDCCSDYTQLCTSSGSTSSPSSVCGLSYQQLTERLWQYDDNRLVVGTDMTLNYQSQLTSGVSDRSNSKLFAWVNEQSLQGPTYQAFIRLLNNFNPVKGQRESDSTNEEQEVATFLDAILNTRVMNTLKDYLICKGVVTSAQDFRSKLMATWFDYYPRSSNSAIPDTNGFEHVMVGEYKSSTKVNGFHYWLSFYQKEKADTINYYGYVRIAQPNLVAAAFQWNNRLKSRGSFFVGTSPEFDMAFYSLCFLTDRRCTSKLDGHSVVVQTHAQGSHLASAFPSM